MKPDAAELLAGKLLAERYPKMLQCLADALRHQQGGNVVYTFHLDNNGEPQKFVRSSQQVENLN